MSINRGMDKDMVHIYSAMLLMEKNEIMPFVATWMDLKITVISEVSLTEGRQIHGITYMWN